MRGLFAGVEWGGIEPFNALLRACAGVRVCGQDGAEDALPEPNRLKRLTRPRSICTKAARVLAFSTRAHFLFFPIATGRSRASGPPSGGTTNGRYTPLDRPVDRLVDRLDRGPRTSDRPV